VARAPGHRFRTIRRIVRKREGAVNLELSAYSAVRHRVQSLCDVLKAELQRLKPNESVAVHVVAKATTHKDS
jgi:hypothetical protein